VKVEDTGIVYLYRFVEGEAPVRRFLASYHQHPAGLAHDLHVILKGFPDRGAVAAARALFAPLPVNTIELGDTGYDIGSYFAAARAVANPQLLFLNTFSEILADNWLRYFAAALAVPGIGVAGATGSLQSLSSGLEAVCLGALRRVVARFKTADKSAEIGTDLDAVGEHAINAVNIPRGLRRAGAYPLHVYQYGRYPNPHIRTNGFMIRRDLFLSLRAGRLRNKADAYKFESGRASMTRQIMARGLSPVVVDRSGKPYAIPQWQSSSTFWINGQVNLMIADNQTRDYANGDAKFRVGLKQKAWDHPSLWKLPWYNSANGSR
jgi:hypothetical protein